ncbi:MAG: hypothetical protein KIS92_20465 [Planctomycetota bacterium]|nr:hypothetical protein [Planctomycetota bacterium]
MIRSACGLVLISAMLCAHAEEPAALSLAKLELDSAVWGDAQKIDEKDCRALKAGKTGVVPLAVYWAGDALRPAEGDNRVLVITFKDTASAPIRVDAYAGLPGRYELHRIGGLNDGQWKTARVPLPWDMVMRGPKDPKATELYFSAPGGADVPVASIALEKGDPAADEAAWSAETRAWIARAQGEKRANAKLPKAEEAVLPEAWKDKKAVAFTRGYVTMVQATSAPKQGEAGAALKIRLATNEIEPAQLGVYANGADLKGVTVALAPEGLSGEAGKLDAKIELFAAEYSVVRDGRLFPQRLWPAYPVDIASGRAHAFWITVATEGTAKPGVYKGKLAVAAGEGISAEVPLEVEVLPIKLLTMTEAGLDLGGCISGLLPAHELHLKAANNHNSLNLWYSGFAPGIVKKSATEFDLDFTVADEFMKQAKAAGIRNFIYFLGGDPYGAPDTWHLQRELYRFVHYDGKDMMEGRKEFIKRVTESREKMLPELRALYVQWTKKFMAHAKEAGWPEPILTPFDEPAKWTQDGNRAQVYYYKDKNGHDHVDKIKDGAKAEFLKKLKDDGIEPQDLGLGGAGSWIKPQFKQACEAIHEGWPEARIYGSIHHAKPGIVFLPDIEVFCTNAIHEDRAQGDQVRAGGPTKTFWQYSGGGDSSEPAQGRYNFGFFFGAYDSRGSLCWAYNWGARFDTSVGDSWLYAWTTPYAIARAPFWEGMREGWDDRRYIETLRAEAKKAGPEQVKAAEALLKEIFDVAVGSRTEGGRDTVNDFWARTKDADALDTQRARIAEMIVKLKK